MINVQTTPGSDVPVFKSQDRQNFFYPHLNHLQIEKRRISELTMGRGNKVQDITQTAAKKKKKKHLNSLLTLFSLSISLCVCVYVDFPRRRGANCHLDQPGMDIYPAIQPLDSSMLVVWSRVVLRCRRTRRKRLTHSLIVSFYLEQRIEIDRNKEEKKSQRNSLNSCIGYIQLISGC